jgi:AraC-like DNA-binding protein
MREKAAAPSPDVQIWGTDTRFVAISAEPIPPDDTREWLRHAAVCPLLEQHQIAHAGLMQAMPPFEIMRNHLSGTFMLACYEGEGTVLADEGWKKIRAGQACIQPPFVRNALKCLPGKPWKFAWVRYRESPDTAPIVSSISPVIGEFDPTPLKAAIDGLHAEAKEVQNLSAMHQWSQLIHHYVLRFAQPHRSDRRLWRLWQRIEAELARPWTLQDLAGIACMSEEHLRRVCRKEIGRTPMQHLTFLRIQQARHLLSISDDKVEVIARAVGFESAFTFSNTFKKWTGWRPSEHRGESTD